MFTTWIERPNSRLNDYAHHQLAGLLSGYYAQRWKIFFADSENAEAKLDEIERNAPFADWKTPPKNGNLLEIAEAEFCGVHSKTPVVIYGPVAVFF